MKTVKELELSLLIKEAYIQQLKLKVNKLEEELNKYKYRPSSKINFDKLMISRKETEKLNEEVMQMRKLYFDLKDRINKAIEYINGLWLDDKGKILEIKERLYFILKGEDNE